MAYASWLTPNKTSGTGNDTISFSATEFTGRQARTTEVTFTTTSGGTVTATLDVTQTAAGNILTAANPATVPAAGGTSTITGTSNSSKLKVDLSGTGFTVSKIEVQTSAEGPWTEITSDEAIDGDPGALATYNFRITVTVTKNDTVSSRSAEVTITPGEGTAKEVTITQTAGSATLSLNKESITIPAAGTAQSVEVTSNTSWSVS